MMNYRPLLWMGLMAVLATQAGCVRESVGEAGKTFAYELYVPVLLFFGGIAAAVAGWYLRGGRFGWVLMIGGVISTLGFAPSMFLDKVTVDDKHFTVRTGIWGLTNVHDVAYDNLTSVELTKEEKRGRRGRKSTSYYLLCHCKDGTSAKVPLNNQVCEAAAFDILTQIKDHNVPIGDATGE
jgi:hypothetical protein